VEEKDDHYARMLMFGKPGAGKGTLTARLTQKYDILTLSTGDLLRQHILEGTDVGKEAEAIMARGELVPDDVVLRVVTSKLDSLQNKVTLAFSRFVHRLKHSIKHWILDGFPRTLKQGELLDQHLKYVLTPPQM
jgi:adenylate kinase family enzyme